MYSARSTAASGTSPQDDISLEEFPKSKRTAERYKVDCDDGGDDDYGDDASFVDSYARSDDSRYTLYSEPIGYVAPKSHREMELYIASVHGNREVVARIDHFIGPSSKAKVSPQKNSITNSCAESHHPEYEQSRLNRSNDTLTRGNKNESLASANASARKQQQILGIGVKYPEPPPGIRRSTHTGTDAYHAQASGVRSGFSATCVSILGLKAPPTLTTKSKGIPKPPKDKKTTFKFPSFSRGPKPAKQKRILGGHIIEHVTHDHMKQTNNQIADSTDQGTALKDCMPPILRRYDAEIANRRSEEYLAQCTALDPHAEQYTAYLESRSGSASKDSSNRSTESVVRPLYPFKSGQASYSIGEFVPIAPKPPFARGVMHRHSADTLAPVSRGSLRTPATSRNTSVLGEHMGNDSRIWSNSTNEHDISSPTHRVVRDVLPSGKATFNCPRRLDDGRYQLGPDQWRQARDWEIPLNPEGMRGEPLPTNRAPRRRSSNISPRHVNIDTSGTSNSDLRSESRWSANSDEQPQQGGYSWSPPLSWGTSRTNGLGLQNTYDGRDSDIALASYPTLSEVPSTATSPTFKTFGSNLLKKISQSIAVNTNSHSGAASANLARTGQASKVKSILGHIDPATYEDPHPGTRFRCTPPPMKARKVLKDAYMRPNSAKREERRDQKRRDEL